MKPIKIEEKNRNMIIEVINAVEGKSAVNLLAFQQIVKLGQSAEKRMEDLGIPMKYRSAAEFDYQPSGPDSSSYKYPQGATSVSIIRKSTGWFIKNIERISVYPKQKEVMSLKLSEMQKDIAIKRLCSSFTIMAKPEVELGV